MNLVSIVLYAKSNSFHIFAVVANFSRNLVINKKTTTTKPQSHIAAIFITATASGHETKLNQLRRVG